jgi:hypothetical protein
VQPRRVLDVADEDPAHAPHRRRRDAFLRRGGEQRLDRVGGERRDVGEVEHGVGEAAPVAAHHADHPWPVGGAGDGERLRGGRCPAPADGERDPQRLARHPAPDRLADHGDPARGQDVHQVPDRPAAGRVGTDVVTGLDDDLRCGVVLIGLLAHVRPRFPG